MQPLIVCGIFAQVARQSPLRDCQVDDLAAQAVALLA